MLDITLVIRKSPLYPLLFASTKSRADSVVNQSGTRRYLFASSRNTSRTARRTRRAAIFILLARYIIVKLMTGFTGRTDEKRRKRRTAGRARIDDDVGEIDRTTVGRNSRGAWFSRRVRRVRVTLLTHGGPSEVRAVCELAHLRARDVIYFVGARE